MTMDEIGFSSFLKHGGRSPSAVKRCVSHVQEFERFLQDHRGGRALEEANPTDLEQFVNSIECQPKASANTHLWALRYYFEYNAKESMRSLASTMREQRIKRTPFPLNEFRGVEPEYIEKLAVAGIRNVSQMLQAGRTPQDRLALAKKTGVPLEAILDYVKLSDLARVPGLKGIRARLYYDAGVDTLEKLAGWDPEKLRAMLIGFVERTDFNGIAPLPKEAASAVETAKRLPTVVEYDVER
jgi:hypothetical protein